jgi:hypothetical protein
MWTGTYEIRKCCTPKIKVRRIHHLQLRTVLGTQVRQEGVV